MAPRGGRNWFIGAGAIALATTVGVLALPGDDGGSSRPLDDGELCDALRTIDPGRALGGVDADDLATAAVALAELSGRAPGDLAKPLAVIEDRLDRSAAARRLPDLSSDDDGYGEAYQAAYALRYDAGFSRAATYVERYAVDECDVTPSGNFDLGLARTEPFDAIPKVELTGPQLAGAAPEFDPATFEPYELQPFDIPDVSFQADLGQFTFEPEPIPTPDLSEEAGDDAPPPPGGT